jgi:thioredoxin-like negative regulator of GroEL
MAPVVHGLATQYEGRVDFLYLDIADPRNANAAKRLGFEATPHFFFLRADGTPVARLRGVVPRDSLAGALDRLLAADAP